MSLNLGGIYVGVRAGVTAADVATSIEAYWLALGALPLAPDRDPLAISPLSLKQTAELAFAVAPAGEDAGGASWIAVYDSERYTADPALARHLAEQLAVPVVFYEVSGASGDHAYVKVYGEGGPTPPKRDDVQAWLEGFPYALLYFNHLQDDRAALQDFRCFGFRDVPYRPTAKYAGPSEAERRELAAKVEIRALAEAGDAAGVKALGADHPGALLGVLQRLDQHDLGTAAGRAFVLALADEAIAQQTDLYIVAEAAALAGDEALLARAQQAMGARGHLWALLERRALARIHAGDLVVGWRLLQACVEGPAASLTAWRDHAWVVAALPAAARLQLPARPVTAETMRPWLQRALAVAPMHPTIFLNVARAALALDLRELALSAVEGAVAHRTPAPEAVRTDETLRALFDEPRFMAAVASAAAMGPDELAALVTVLPIRGEPHVLHRAVISMTFYLAGELAEVGRRIGRLLDAYREDLAPGTLTHYRRGRFKPLTKAMITKERKFLDAIAANLESLTIHHSSTDGDAPEYAFEVEGSREDGGASVVVVFPVTSAHEPETLCARFARYAELVGCESAHAGYGVTNRDSGSYEGVSWNRAELPSRFLGFEHRSPWWTAGRTPPAHWLVWLAPSLIEALGGAGPLAAAIGEATLTEHAGAVLLRAARRPVLAPVAAPEDRGAVPELARALRPLRIDALGASNVAFLARWDELSSTSWDN